MVKIDDMISFHNKYEIKVTDTKTGKIENRTAYNIVCDGWKDMLMGNNARNKSFSIRFGSGMTPPTAQDTSLEAEFGNKSIPTSNQYYDVSNATEYDEQTKTTTYSYTMTIGTTEFVDQLFAEIGLYNSGLNLLASRALFTDSEGNPMPIGPKTDTEIYDITFTGYFKFNPSAGYVNRVGYKPADAISEMLQGKHPTPSIHSYQNLSKPTLRETYGETKIYKTYRLEQDESNGFIELNAMPKLHLGNIPLVAKFPNMWFPQQSFEERIGTGDGINKRFGLATPFWDSGTVQIKVDGVAVNHTQLGNCERFPINLSGLDGVYDRNVIWKKTDENFENAEEIEWDDEIEFPTELKSYSFYELDLGEIMKISHIRASQPSYVKYLDSSGEWVAFTNSTHVGNNVYAVDEEEARYLRYSITSSSDRYGYVYASNLIELENPPQNGAVVTASWKTSIPPKNINLEYDMAFTFQY